MTAFTRESLAAEIAEAQKQATAARGAVSTPAETSNKEQGATEVSSTSEDTGNTADVSGDDAAVDAALAATSEDNTAADDAESAPADEGTESDGVEESDGNAGHQQRPSRFQKRIDGLISERTALKQTLAHRDELISRLLADQQARGAAPATPAPAAAAPPMVPSDTSDPAPTLDQHEFDMAKWAEAHAAWSQRQIDRGIKVSLQAIQVQQSVEAQQKAFLQRMDAYEASHPGFKDAVSNPALPPLHDKTVKLLIGAETGPAILDHFARNPEVLARVARLTPEQQAMAIGRIEVSVITPKTNKAPQKSVTKAPAPPSRVPAGSAPNSRDLSDPKLSMQDFAKAHFTGKSKPKNRR